MSSEPVGQRPGGLTALGVINIVFGGFGVIGLLGSLAMLGLLDGRTREEMTGDVPRKELLYLSLLLGVGTAILLILSGVGYLQQKRFLGKILGNLYGLLGLVSSGVAVAAVGDLDIGTLIGLVYPVFTLTLLNTVFKDDFPNP